MMNKELNRLLQNCVNSGFIKDHERKDILKYIEDNNFVIRFVDGRTLHDFGGMNPVVAEQWGFPYTKPKEYEIDRTLPEDIQCQNLKHELHERALVANGAKYWPAHLESLRIEKRPFEIPPKIEPPQPTQEVNMIPVGNRWQEEEEFKEPKRKQKAKSPKKRKGILARLRGMKT